MEMKMSQADMQSLMNRLMRLIRLDTTVFDEVRLDASTTIPSIIVAAVSMLLTGLGGWLYWVMTAPTDAGGSDVFLKSALLGSALALLLWVAWVGVAYLLLTQVFRAQADIQQLIRTMGMAMIPLALTILMFIPGVSFGIALAAVALTFGLSTMAIQAATNASPAQVLLANAAGIAVWALVLTVLSGDIEATRSGISINSYAPGIFLFALGT